MSSARGFLWLAILALASACNGSGNTDGAKASPEADAGEPAKPKPDAADAKKPQPAAEDAQATPEPDASPPAPDVGADVDPPDAQEPPADTGGSSPRPPLVFVFTRTTGYRHESIEAEAAALKAALAPSGITVETGADPKVFTPAELGRFGAVVLLSTTGKPLGDPGTAAIEALAGFVKAGGGLAAIHAASSTEYDPALPYTPLIGGKFVDHPGSVRAAVCHVEGTHPSVAKLPRDFPVRDEIYQFSNLRPDNQIDVRCDAFSGGGRLPVAWHRQEGAGRVFYTALGHGADELAAGKPLLAEHIVPGVLWTLGR